MITQTLDQLSAQHKQTITSTYFVSGKECDIGTARAFLKTLLNDKFLQEVLNFAITHNSKYIMSSATNLREEAVRFSAQNPYAAIIAPEQYIRYIISEPYIFSDVGLVSCGKIDTCALSATNIAIGSVLFLENGWLVYNVDTDIDERIGSDGRSYSGRATISGAWSINPDKITRLLI